MSSLPNEVTMVLVTRDDLEIVKGQTRCTVLACCGKLRNESEEKAMRLYERWNNFGRENCGQSR
ncbi:MAG: hypothetical protein CM15mP9_5070 [Methanobacteriota archaeon]|nr:MAG: hypothetical protein CM15mP9_5070 [Euryarchaeota archaeon]